MYTLLTSAIKNVGDFFIAERCKHLLKTLGEEKDFLEFKRWEPLDERLAEINETKAIILCGGPGYHTNFYPGIFTFVKNINDIKVPIIPYGLGWLGSPMYHPEHFRFNESSMTLLQYIHENCEATSCRDNATKEILNRYNFQNVIMTGCPTWYDLDSIGKKFEKPKEIHCVAISMTPTSLFFKQNVELLKQAGELFKSLCPSVELWAVFHRGIVEDEFTPPGEAKSLQSMANYAEKIGYRVFDLSYDASNIDIYRRCDLHVGFRVHAHIFFLSIRKPTFLLQVDGRGRALSETLGLIDVPLQRDVSMPSVLSNVKSSLPTAWRRVLGKIGIIQRIYRQATASPNQDAVSILMKEVEEQLINGFPTFQKVDATLDNYFKEMVRFLKTLP
jgi:hypothetical protein